MWQARLSKSLNELRVVYCSSSASSAGTREFVQRNYRSIKAQNPRLPIYVRTCQGVEPHVAARYERGMYEVKKTSNMSSDKVLEAVRQLETIATEVNSRPGFKGFGGKPPKLAEVI